MTTKTKRSKTTKRATKTTRPRKPRMTKTDKIAFLISREYSSLLNETSAKFAKSEFVEQLLEEIKDKEQDKICFRAMGQIELVRACFACKLMFGLTVDEPGRLDELAFTQFIKMARIAWRQRFKKKMPDNVIDFASVLKQRKQNVSRS